MKAVVRQEIAEFEIAINKQIDEMELTLREADILGAIPGLTSAELMVFRKIRKRISALLE